MVKVCNCKILLILIIGWQRYCEAQWCYFESATKCLEALVLKVLSLFNSVSASGANKYSKADACTLIKIQKYYKSRTFKKCSEKISFSGTHLVMTVR
jgi:hypothetical protein